MSSKGLRALERIKSTCNYKECVKIIKKQPETCLSKRVKDLDIIENELKALEIIKEKPQATLWLIQHCDKEMEYEDMLFLFKEDVTKEQFNLLKGVLL